MQQSQYQNFLPYFNPSMFINQSLQFANQPLHFSLDGTQMLNQRASMPQNFENLPVQYLGNLDSQIPANTITLSPIRGEMLGGSKSPEHMHGSAERSTKGNQPYDTANEQIPLKKPQSFDDEPIQTRFEFDNEQFNSKSNFKPGKAKPKKSTKEVLDEVPVGMGGGADTAMDANYETENQPKKTKAEKKKELEKKKEFLKRRKRYDPRKAIEKEKRKKTKK